MSGPPDERKTSNDRQEPHEPAALTAFAELGKEAVSPPGEPEIERGLDLLLARVAFHRQTARQWSRWSRIAGASLGVLAFACLALWLRARYATPPPLAYSIVGGSVLQDGSLHAAGSSELRVLFDEGTSFALPPNSEARLGPVAREGATLALARGSAAVEVTPGYDRRWTVSAGPFLVTVKGTAFSLSWDPEHERFELSLRHGHVVVSGPVTGNELGLHGGQRLVVNVPRAEALIVKDDWPLPVPTAPVHAADTSASAQPLSPPERPRLLEPSPHGAPARHAASATTSPTRSARRWREALARGAWDDILSEVARGGVEATLEGATGEELMIVANAARYRRRWELASAALQAERRRFGGSIRALDATYLLGRVAESKGATPEALSWYDAYLAEAPAGPYAGESLGRKMTLTHELEGPKPARALAATYLRRFPSGSYAAAARALLREP